MSEFTGCGRMIKIKGKEEHIDFGDYVEIEQKRYGVPNENFIFKVVGCISSNCFMEVPMQAGVRGNGVPHKHMEHVLRVVQCGIDEEHVVRVKMSDCKYIGTAHN
jgi:hypothetical protein